MAAANICVVKRILLTLLVMLLCRLGAVAGAPSEEVTVTVHAFPTCQVYLDTPMGLSYLGRSGAPLRVTPPLLRDPQGTPVQYASAVVVLRCDGHGDVRVPVAAQDWAAGRLPSSGRYDLPASSVIMTARDYATEYPVVGALAICGVLAGAWWVRRWRRQAALAEARLETLSAHLDTAGDPLIGKHVGRYRVEARLGQGGMGAVYRVVDDGGGAYAAKIVYLEAHEDPLTLDRFRREFKLLSQLRHPTFPRCFDYFELDGMACAVMELVPGRTLRKHLAVGGLPWEQVGPWIRSILEALAFAHERGIVHRDLKPDNIMISDGQVRIFDFGLARSSRVAAITMTGEGLGTPRYLAPEQLSSRSTDVDPRTDLYSLGVMIFELLTGAPPFQGEHVDVIRMHLQEVPPRLEGPNVPQGLADIVAVLLDKNPVNRYQSARRVLELLDALGGDAQDTVNVASDTLAVSPPPE